MSDEFEINADLLKGGIPSLIEDTESGLIDLTHLVEEDQPGRRPPSLVDDPSILWPSHSGLHSSLLSTTTPTESAEAWQALVEELAEESRLCGDKALEGTMLAEAGRILVDRLGRQEEGELLLRRSSSPVADVLRKDTERGTSSLAAELSTLEAVANDTANDVETRAAAWIEFGQLCEERTSNRRRAFEAYSRAIEVLASDDAPRVTSIVALSLAAETAMLLDETELAEQYVREQLRLTTSTRQRVALLLQLAELSNDPEERVIILEQAHQAEPAEEAVLRRLSRALSAAEDRDQLGQLYRDLAQVAEDPISASTALHLAFLTLAEGGHPVNDLVLELANRDADGSEGADMLAPLAEVALYVEQRIAAGDDSRGLPHNESVLERLSRCLDDPREQALVREQLARLRLRHLREQEANAPAPRDPGTGLPRLSEDRAILADKLEADLRFCLVHLPEHRWIREALAELLAMRANLPALILHLQEWARTQTAGPGRAAILLRLGGVHERMRRDLPRAAEIYELAVAEDPENPNCLRALGYVYEQMRRWPQAVASLRRQADESADDSERLAALRRVAALAEQELGDIDLAIAALEEIAALDPDDLRSLYQLAKLCRSHRRPTVLITALDLLVHRVDDPVARTALLVELGEVQELQLKQRSSAQTCYERALALTPGYTPALRALSRLYRDNGDLDALLGLLEPDVDTVTDPAVLSLKAGRVALDELGDLDRAIAYVQRAYETNPDLGPAREQLFAMLTTKGRMDEAYDLLRAQETPKSPALAADHHYRLGLLAEAVARRSSAGAPARRSRQGGSSDEPPTLESAALQHYRSALLQQPDHGLAFERSRRLLVAHNDTANLIRLIESLLQAGGDDARTVHLVHLGRLHVAEARASDAARRAYEEAFDSAPDDPIVRREFEALLRLLGDRRSLPALYLRAAETTDDTHFKATLLVEAAELLLTTGEDEDHAVAGQAILDALKVDPGNPYAVRHLERLLSEPESTFVIKDAVSARAVRAQSEAERAIFYVESAELLERVGAWSQARRAYLAAKGALPNLAAADLGLARTSSENRRATTAQSVRTSIHVLVAEARDAAVRAGRGDANARARAIRIIGEILQRDPTNRDAVGLARTLAGQVGDAAPLLEILSRTFQRIDDADLRYELGLFLGESSLALEEAVRYYDAAAEAKPDGRRALRGLVNSYRQMGDDARAAAATERLLELFEPGEPSAIDLRMGIASFLSSAPETLPRALEHARIVFQARPDDPKAIALMADLLERSGHKTEAADLLVRLADRERNRDRLHDIHLRRARLLADVPDKQAAALAAVERAATLAPGNRDTITLLVEQLDRSGQSARVANYLQPIRSALLANVGRGAVSLRDLKLLARVSSKAKPELSRMANAVLQAIEPSAMVAKSDWPSPPPGPGLRRVLDSATLRTDLYASGEPPQLHGLLQSIDGVVARLGREFPVVSATDIAAMPAELDVTPLREHATRLSSQLGIRVPRLGASGTHNAVVLLQDPIPVLRIGTNLWNQGDVASLRGLIALAAARHALGAPRARALSGTNLDLLLSACFEVVEVFNPMTAETDPRRLRDLVVQLRNLLPQRQRKALEQACQAMASHAFDAGNTTRATTATDLHVAALMSGDLVGCIGAACLLDGVVGGSLKGRVNRSRTAQELLAHLISDEFLQAVTVAHAGGTRGGA
jgi:cellulose synthase operon protein C